VALDLGFNAQDEACMLYVDDGNSFQLLHSSQYSLAGNNVTFSSDVADQAKVMMLRWSND
jgi:hypothetical protein